MDGTSLLVGIGIGGALFGAAGYIIANLLARTRGAAEQAANDAVRAEFEGIKRERDVLRGQLSSAQQSEAGAKASLAAAQQAALDMRAQADAERARADEQSRARAKAEQEAKVLESSLAEREAATAKLLAEREKSINELRATVEQAKGALNDAFKATGADVLKATAETLIKQAKEQFEGQQKLSSQELEARQKSIDATIAPLREQLAKQEELVTALGEKREGDAKTLGEPGGQYVPAGHGVAAAPSGP